MVVAAARNVEKMTDFQTVEEQETEAYVVEVEARKRGSELANAKAEKPMLNWMLRKSKQSRKSSLLQAKETVEIEIEEMDSGGRTAARGCCGEIGEED